MRVVTVEALHLFWSCFSYKEKIEKKRAILSTEKQKINHSYIIIIIIHFIYVCMYIYKVKGMTAGKREREGEKKPSPVIF